MYCRWKLNAILIAKNNNINKIALQNCMSMFSRCSALSILNLTPAVAVYSDPGENGWSARTLQKWLFPVFEGPTTHSLIFIASTKTSGIQLVGLQRYLWSTNWSATAKALGNIELTLVSLCSPCLMLVSKNCRFWITLLKFRVGSRSHDGIKLSFHKFFQILPWRVMVKTNGILSDLKLQEEALAALKTRLGDGVTKQQLESTGKSSSSSWQERRDLSWKTIIEFHMVQHIQGLTNLHTIT